MDEKELQAACIELMAVADTVFLAANEAGGYPRIRAMLNLRNRTEYPKHVHLYADHDDDFMVYLTTNTSSRKRADIEADPKVGLYYRHPDRRFGLSLIGDVEIVDDMETKTAVWADGWEVYYPSTGRPDDPDYTLLRIFPTSARGWTGAETFAFSIGT
jgi:general stress protein 26